MADKQTQYGGSHNQQAMGNITNNFLEKYPISFDLLETEKMIDDLYSVAKTMNLQEDITYRRMDISGKNTLNEMELYFKEQIQHEIMYFSEIDQVLHSNEEAFQARFEFIIRTIKGAILAVDNNEKLTPSKINIILDKFFKQDWGAQKKIRAIRLVHYMYFNCFLGKKEVNKK